MFCNIMRVLILGFHRLILGQTPHCAWTTAHQITPQLAQPLPTRTTIPIKDHSPLRLLPTRTTTTQENHSSGPIPLQWGIVLVGRCPDRPLARVVSRGLLHKSFYRRKLWLFFTRVFSCVKVNGRIMLT